VKKVIWKFTLRDTGRNDIDVPHGAQFLNCQVQGERACIWMLVDPTAPKEARKFDIIATGEEVPGDMKYLATFLSYGGMLVWHLFGY